MNRSAQLYKYQVLLHIYYIHVNNKIKHYTLKYVLPVFKTKTYQNYKHISQQHKKDQQPYILNLDNLNHSFHVQPLPLGTVQLLEAARRFVPKRRPSVTETPQDGR